MINQLSTFIALLTLCLGLAGCQNPGKLSKQEVELIKTDNLAASGKALVIAGGHFMHRPSRLFGEQPNTINLTFIRTSQPGNKASIANKMIGKAQSLVRPGIYADEASISVIPAGHWSLYAWSSNLINQKISYSTPGFPFVKLVSFSVQPGEVIYLGNLKVRLAPAVLRKQFTMEVVNRSPWARQKLAKKFPQKAAQMVFRKPQLDPQIQYHKK